jgi:hypothetical protein
VKRPSNLDRRKESEPVRRGGWGMRAKRGIWWSGPGTREFDMGVRSPLQLIISPTPSGWQVIDADWRLPASWYTTREEAQREASDYLAMRGGGQLILREGRNVVSIVEVEGSQPEAA